MGKNQNDKTTPAKSGNPSNQPLKQDGYTKPEAPVTPTAKKGKPDVEERDSENNGGEITSSNAPTTAGADKTEKKTGSQTSSKGNK